ncbi:MAG: SulP family inorganic anion transporter [Planctomycetota bacterium]
MHTPAIEHTGIDPTEKPQNGVAGLKYIRNDILSGIVVSLVSLPLSSGIAIASGAPPIYGLISAIIAGLIFPFIGGAYLTIAGPAAGLAPALMAIMVALGGAGNAEGVGEGYRFLIVVIFMVGCLQIVLALLKLARFASAIPLSVVEGMLASIGILIMVKQLPMFLGYKGNEHPHEFIEYIADIPSFFAGMTSIVGIVGLSTLLLLFTLGALQKKVPLLKVIPPHLFAVVFGLILGQVVQLGKVDPTFLLKLPENPFDGIHSPHFAELFSRTDLWYAAAMGVITLTLIDGVESLATAIAIDRIDPYKRRSAPNRVLLAMGISNIASSLVGGLTIIPGGVKSKVNIASGGKTLWANFTNAVCLVIYLIFARDLINLIPKCVLAAVLIYTGWKMCEPMVWRHMAKIGKEQLAIFAFTIAVTLATDLLWGIIAGLIATLLLDGFLYYGSISNLRGNGEEHPTTASGLLSMFRNPVSKAELIGDVYHVSIDGPLSCFNSMLMSERIESIPWKAREVVVHVGPSTYLIDHTACENLMHAVEIAHDANIPMRLDGMQSMKRLSAHHACVHVMSPSVAVS